MIREYTNKHVPTGTSYAGPMVRIVPSDECSEHDPRTQHHHVKLKRLAAAAFEQPRSWYRQPNLAAASYGEKSPTAALKFGSETSPPSQRKNAALFGHFSHFPQISIDTAALKAACARRIKLLLGHSTVDNTAVLRSVASDAPSTNEWTNEK